MRYREDRGRQYGALLSYYGFISLFPLLLVLVTVLGIVLQDDPTRRDKILDTVYDKIPVIGEQLRQNPASLNTSGLMLVFGLLVSIWSGLAVVRVAQDALNLQWGVPRYRWPTFITRMLRAVTALLVVGLGILVATAVTNLAAFLPDLPTSGRLAGAALGNRPQHRSPHRFVPNPHPVAGELARAPPRRHRGGCSAVGAATDRGQLRDEGHRRGE